MENIRRILQDRIFSRIENNKVVLIVGARRVGKTVLLKHLIRQFQGKALLLNGEDQDALSLSEKRSITNYRRLPDGMDLLAIDEAQKIPDVGLKLK